MSGEPEDRISSSYDLARFIEYCGSVRVGKNRGRPSMAAGDRVILSRMASRTDGASDHCVYGRAQVDVEHRPGIDELPSWLEALLTKEGWEHEQRWPFVVWLRNVEIVKGMASDAPWLSDITFGDSPVVKPASLRQHSHIALDESQLTRFDDELEAAFERVGAVRVERPGGIPWSRHLIDPTFVLNRDVIEERARRVRRAG